MDIQTKRKLEKYLRLVIIVAVAAIIIFPVYWLLTTSLKPPEEWHPTHEDPHLVPKHITIDNFRMLFSPWGVYETFAEFRETMFLPIRNSLILSVTATALALIIGTCASYSMSRYKSGGEFTPFFILMFRMFPPIAVIVPIMILYSAFRLLDTGVGMILFYTVISIPFVIWIMKSFFDEVPIDIDEAAILDGCSPPQVFFKVVLPLVKPGMAVTGLFIFVMCWSDFLGALVLAQRYWFTIPIALATYTGLYGYLYGPIAALGAIAMIPCVAIGIIIQKYLVRGFTFGAVKR